MNHRWALLGVLALAACEEPNVPPPNLARMIDQDRGTPYAASTAFDDGALMRTPPPGTVANDPDRGGPAFVADEASPPFPATLKSLELGRQRFEQYCAACHGLAGDGVSSVALRMALRPPPSLVYGKVLPPGRIVRTINVGYGLMRPYSTELPTAEERWAIASYVGVLTLRRAMPLADLPAPLRAKAEAQLP